MVTTSNAKQSKGRKPKVETPDAGPEPGANGAQQAVPESAPADPAKVNDKPKRQITRAQIFGYPVTAVLRWMGVEGWSFADARAAINAFGAGGISDTTIRIQLPAGRKGDRGAPAPITKQQAAELKAAATKAGGDA